MLTVAVIVLAVAFVWLLLAHRRLRREFNFLAVRVPMVGVTGPLVDGVWKATAARIAKTPFTITANVPH